MGNPTLCVFTKKKFKKQLIAHSVYILLQMHVRHTQPNRWLSFWRFLIVCVCVVMVVVLFNRLLFCESHLRFHTVMIIPNWSSSTFGLRVCLLSNSIHKSSIAHRIQVSRVLTKSKMSKKPDHNRLPFNRLPFSQKLFYLDVTTNLTLRSKIEFCVKQLGGVSCCLEFLLFLIGWWLISNRQLPIGHSYNATTHLSVTLKLVLLLS